MWEVYLYTSAPNLTDENIAAIYPTSTDWNDFGYKFQAILRIKVDGALHDFPIRLLPFIDDIPQSHVSRWIDWMIATKDKPEDRPKNRIYPPYTAILNSVETYQELASIVSIEKYESLLEKIFEINAIRESGKISVETYHKITQTTPFKTAILREGQYYMAFRFGYYSAKRTPLPKTREYLFSSRSYLMDKNHHTRSI